MVAQLRVYKAPADDVREERPEPTVRVRLGDLIPLVTMAQRSNFLWVKDFLDDEVAVSDDLYDVMQSFRSSRPSA